jgi:hypothetical protein
MPKFNTSRKKDSDQYSFGGSEDREPIENWQQLVNQREELRNSIMSIKNPKLSRLSGLNLKTRVSEGSYDGPFSPCRSAEKLQSDLLMNYCGIENA